MEYFLISNSTDKKEVGHYIQCKGMPDGYNYKWYDEPNSMTNLTNDTFPDFEPDLVFELEKKAKLTDVISTSNISAKGFLVNEKIKNIFDRFNLMEHKYYPAIVIYKEQKFNYYWLHFKENESKYLNYIKYNESKFYIGNLARWKEKDVVISDVKTYLNLRKNLVFKLISIDTICFNNTFYNKPKDIFYIDNLHFDFIISETLKNVMQESKITGFHFYIPKFSIL